MREFQSKLAPVIGLPRQRTPFIGRSDELAKITRLLIDHDCRLLTLVGVGGIGKTRLAIEAAASVPEQFADGVAFANLQPLDSPDYLVSAIADALQLKISGGEDSPVALLNYLNDKELLLVLDNFEHLLEGAGLLSDILSATQGVKFLITSRETLNLREEWVRTVEGLDFPEAAGAGDIETYSAVQLFVQHARQVSGSFSLQEEKEHVVRICQLVAGMPLALEMAAAWTRTLNCERIVHEIQRNLDFLATNLRNVPPRHHSMQAVFDQSWKSLSAEEQAVFARLSVFRGGFTLDAAEQVAAASPAILSALVDKSLLRRESDSRYQIHELLRQYAQEQLERSREEAEHVHDRHRAYYISMLASAMASMLGGKQRDMNEALGKERDNLRSAWQRATAIGQVEEMHEAAMTLGLFYQFRSQYREAVDMIEQAIRALEKKALGDREWMLASLRVTQGWILIRLGEFEKAKQSLTYSYELYSRLDIDMPPGSATDPALPLGILASIRGDYTEAERLGEEARKRSEAANHLWNRQFAYYLLTSALSARGRYDEALRYAQLAYAMTEETDDRWFMAYCLNELGTVARAVGDYEVATQRFRASYTLRESFRDPEGMAVALNHMGKVALLQNKLSTAQSLFEQSLSIYREIADKGGWAAAHEGLGNVATGTGDYQTARKQLHEALRIATGIQFVPLTLSILASIGHLLLQDGEPERAVQLLAFVLQYAHVDHEVRQRVERTMAESGLDVVDSGELPGEGELEQIAASVLVDLLAPSNLQVAAQRATTEKEPVALGGPNMEETPQPLVEPLTERELEVLRLLAQGYSNQEIAQELIVAIGTVKAHNHSIYGKLNARNRVEAVSRAQELQLL